MIKTIEDFESRLRGLAPDDDAFAVRTDELVVDLAPAIANKVYLPIFRYFERFPDAACGAPGTLVHLVEECYPNYVEALIESVERRPSFNGTLMINRILNSVIDDSLRSRLIGTLKHVAANPDSVAPHVLEMVLGFIDRHV